MDAQVERMGKGQVKTVLFAAVADGPLIGRRASGGLYATREPTPGELPTATWWQVDQVRARITKGALKPIMSPADVDAVRREGGTGALLAAEGGDFLEGKIAGVEAAHRRGLRSIQLVHYRVNELGDIQTEPPRHGGLTPFGQDVIREMNRLGMVVDLAHLTHDGVRQAVAVTKKPVDPVPHRAGDAVRPVRLAPARAARGRQRRRDRDLPRQLDLPRLLRLRRPTSSG